MEFYERILRYISCDHERKNHYVLRGSLLFRQQVDANRTVKDLDIFITPQYFDSHALGSNPTALVAELVAILDNVASDTNTRIIDVYSEYFVSTRTITVTIAHDDTTITIDIGRDADGLPYEPFTYMTLGGDCLVLMASPVWVALAWKLQILMRGSWRPKDVHDCVQLIEHVVAEPPQPIFRETLTMLIAYRGVDDGRVAVMREHGYGKSACARKKWNRYVNETGSTPIASMDDCWKIIFDWMDKYFFR